MRTIATLQEADAGSISLGDIDVLREKDKVRRLLGYLPQEFGVYPRITAEAMLNHFAVLKGIGNPKERREIVGALLRRTNLYESRKQNLSTFSGGMRQRFGIAQALLGNPKLIIVDEPTAGLDPEERVRFHNLLAEIGENVVVILSTHIVDDVSDLCSQMAIISGGRVLMSGDPQAAVGELEGKVWRRVVAKQELDDFQRRFTIISTKLVAGRTVAIGPAGSPALAPSKREDAADDRASRRPGTRAGHGRLLRVPGFELRLQSRSPMFGGLLAVFFAIHLLAMPQIGIHISDNELTPTTASADLPHGAGAQRLRHAAVDRFRGHAATCDSFGTDPLLYDPGQARLPARPVRGGAGCAPWSARRVAGTSPGLSPAGPHRLSLRRQPHALAPATLGPQSPGLQRRPFAVPAAAPSGARHGSGLHRVGLIVNNPTSRGRVWLCCSIPSAASGRAADPPLTVAS
jgi:ABC-type multidrug transport system ATPase subunit